MQNNVICNICGNHHEVNGEIKAEVYFPTKYVFLNNNAVKCTKCFDVYLTIEGEDYIDLLGKSNIVGEDKEFIRKSNELYIHKQIAKLNNDLVLLIGSQNNSVYRMNIIKNKIQYWETTKIINTKI